MLSTLFFTGARRSALAGIRLGDLFTDQGVPCVLLQEKAQRRIHAPLGDETWQRIQQWLDASGIRRDPPDSYLFRPFQGRSQRLPAKPLSGFMVWRIVKHWAKAAGLRVERLGGRGICAHSSRATAITTALEGGAKVEEVQELVGHLDPRTTMSYRKRTSRDAAKAVNCIRY